MSCLPYTVSPPQTTKAGGVAASCLMMPSSGVVSGSPLWAGRLSPATTKVKLDGLAGTPSGGAPVGNCVIDGKVCPNADAATKPRIQMIFFMRKVSHETRYTPRPGILLRDAAVSSGVPTSWGCSSVGRAPESHSGGHRFDPVQLHQTVIPSAAARPRFRHCPPI